MSTTQVYSGWVIDDLLDLKSLLHEFFTNDVAPLEEKFQAQGFPDKDPYARSGELGLSGMSIPAEYGGGGGGIFANLALLLQEKTKAGAGSLGFAVSEGTVAPYLLAHGAEEQKKHWPAKLCSGEWLGANAMTEPGTGSELQAITTRAVRDGDDYLVTSSIIFTSNGQLCELVIIAVKTDTLGLKGQDTSELFFDNMRVPAANILGGVEGQGFYQLMTQLPQERLITAILAQAVSEAAVAATR